MSQSQSDVPQLEELFSSLVKICGKRYHVVKEFSVNHVVAEMCALGNFSTDALLSRTPAELWLLLETHLIRYGYLRLSEVKFFDPCEGSPETTLQVAAVIAKRDGHLDNVPDLGLRETFQRINKHL